MKAAIALVFFLTVLVQITPLLARAGEEAVRCDIQQGPCTVRTSDGLTVEFDIQPKPVAVMSALNFIVVIRQPANSARSVSSVALDLSMPGMYMGPNQPLLKRTGPGRYEGKGIIPKCITGNKTWRAEIVMRLQDRVSNAAFLFEVN